MSMKITLLTNSTRDSKAAEEETKIELFNGLFVSACNSLSYNVFCEIVIKCDKI